MVAMASRSNSSSDVQFADGQFSPRLQQLYSPLSNYSNISHELTSSTYSQEVMSPQYSVGDDYEDYSQIRLPYRRGRTSQPPEPPIRTSSVASFSSDYSHRPHPSNYQQHYSSYDHRNHNYHQHYSQSRRRTWSPAQIKMGMTGGNLSQYAASCYSNERLDLDVRNGSHGNEEPDPGPPKLAPVSGMLSKSPAKGIIRPIAFKPVVVSNQNYVNTRHFPDRKHSLQDDGYGGSQDYPISNQNVANTSRGSVQMDSDRSTSFSGDSQKHFTPERPESMNSSSVSHVSSVRLGVEGYIQTPSPSDSGVGELEAMLKEKDAEINTLRDVMDKNERAIFQVYEEKKHSWNKELQELRKECEEKVKLQQRKSYKTEQTLSLQVYKLHQEKKSLKEELEKLQKEYSDIKCKCDSFGTENERLRAQLANASFNEGPDADEVSDLQQQVELLNQSLSEKTEETLELHKKLEEQKLQLDNQEKELSDKFREILTKTEEVKSLRANLRRCSNENDMDVSVSDSSLNQSDNEIQMDQGKLSSPVSDLVKAHSRLISQSSPNMIGNTPPSGRRSRSSSTNSKTNSPLRAVDIKDSYTMEDMQSEMRKLRAQLEDVQDNFDKEKEQWLDEKNKVIRYQKQLQLNYVQMYNKNKMLEAEVEQLTLELERRDLKLMALNGGEESVC